MADTPVNPPSSVSPATAPNRSTATDPAVYSAVADTWAASLGAWNTYLTSLGTNVKFNADSAFDSATEAEADAVTASAAADAAEAASSAAEWVSGQAYVAGNVVWSPITFLSYRANTSTSGTTDPSQSSDWQPLSIDEETKTLATSGSINLTPSDAGIQTSALSADATFVDDFDSGQSIVLILGDGASYVVTWPTITWVTSAGNVAPTLTANDTLVFWKVSTTLYGAYVGSGVTP